MGITVHIHTSQYFYDQFAFSSVFVRDGISEHKRMFSPYNMYYLFRYFFYIQSVLYVLFVRVLATSAWVYVCLFFFWSCLCFIIKVKVLSSPSPLPPSCIDDLSRFYIFCLGPLDFLLPEIFKCFGFPLLLLWAYMMKVILETCREH